MMTERCWVVWFVFVVIAQDEGDEVGVVGWRVLVVIVQSW